MTDGPIGPCPFDPRGAWTLPVAGLILSVAAPTTGVMGMRVWKPAAALLAAMGMAAVALPLYAPQSTAPAAPAVVDARVLRVHHGAVPVIVQKLDPADRGPEARIRRLGGSITRDLPIVDGFA